MIKQISFIIISLLSFCMCGCDEQGYNMVWEVVSAPSAETVQVVNNNENLDDPASILIQISDNEGNVVLKCKNAKINFFYLEEMGFVSNEELGYQITEIDTNTLNIHFNNIPSMTTDLSDRFTIYSTDKNRVHTYCNIIRFAE